MTTNKVALPGLTNQRTMSEGQIPENKNPFEVVSNWSPDMMSKIEVLVNEPIETTNDFTRKSKAAARYWSTDVTFKYKTYKSGVIKMAGCGVPFVPGESYGREFMYALCNRAIADAVVKAGNAIGLTVQANDDKIDCSGDTWWKTINKAKGRVGSLDKAGNFLSRDFHNILVKTESGATCTIDGIFKLKASTFDGSNRTSRTPFKINIDCSRMYIKQLNQNISPPELESLVETMKGVKSDIATDDVMEILDRLEL